MVISNKILREEGINIMAAAHNMIKLNIGGTIFTTSIHTLRAQQGSLFEELFTPPIQIKPEYDGCYYIDRNPLVFHHILSFMRGYNLELCELTEKEILILENEAQYYRLPALTSHLSHIKATRMKSFIPKRYFQLQIKSILPKEFSPHFKEGPNYSLSADNTRITCNCDRTWKAVVKGNELPNRGIVRCKIAIIQSKDSHIMIGVAPTSIDQTIEEQYTKCGFYYYTANSNLWSGAPFSYRGKSIGEYGGRETVKEGEEVGVEVNIDKGTVEYFVNGISLGIAYFNLPPSPLCFCVLMHDQDDVIQLLP